MADAAAPRPSFFSDFPRAFSELLSAARCRSLFERFGPRGGGSAKLSSWQWTMAGVYQEFARSGTFSANNVKTITRVTVSDRAL